jgi:hypothetical protein
LANGCVAVRRLSFVESERGRAAGGVVAFCGGWSVCELLFLSGGCGASVLCAESSAAWSPERGLSSDADSVRMVGGLLNGL